MRDVSSLFIAFLFNNHVKSEILVSYDSYYQHSLNHKPQLQMKSFTLRHNLLSTAVFLLRPGG